LRKLVSTLQGMGFNFKLKRIKKWH